MYSQDLGKVDVCLPYHWLRPWILLRWICYNNLWKNGVSNKDPNFGSYSSFRIVTFSKFLIFKNDINSCSSPSPHKFPPPCLIISCKISPSLLIVLLISYLLHPVLVYSLLHVYQFYNFRNLFSLAIRDMRVATYWVSIFKV